MPNKPFASLNPIDQHIRRLSPNKGMTEGNSEPQIRITLIRGFELFNTRPYHNYETFSDGYLAEAFKNGEVIASTTAEDLDEVLHKLEKLLDKTATPK